LAEYYDVTIAAVRPGTHPQALAVLEKTLAGDSDLSACWYSDIGALNRILIIRKSADADAAIENRFAALSAKSPFGIGEFITELSLDTYVPFDFMPPLRPGTFGLAMRSAAISSSPMDWRRRLNCGAKRFQHARVFRPCWQRWSR
jgi:hypothetical protein